jgi:hypothetical protein
LKGPLVGIKAVPLVGLIEAVDCLQGVKFRRKNGTQGNLLEDLKKKNSPSKAMDNASDKLASGKFPTLSVDEAAAIHLYTMETPLYSSLYDAMSSEDAIAIAPFKPYIKLFLTALYKLPIEKHTVYRGTKLKNPSDRIPGNILVWWTFSSTSRRDGVAYEFAEKKKEEGPSAKFIIENAPCINIEELSSYLGEYERLLLPCTALKVLSVTKTSPDEDRWDIQAEFVKGHVAFEFMHPEWPLDLFSSPKN